MRAYGLARYLIVKVTNGDIVVAVYGSAESAREGIGHPYAHLRVHDVCERALAVVGGGEDEQSGYAAAWAGDAACAACLDDEEQLPELVIMLHPEEYVPHLVGVSPDRAMHFIRFVRAKVRKSKI